MAVVVMEDLAKLGPSWRRPLPFENRILEWPFDQVVCRRSVVPLDLHRLSGYGLRQVLRLRIRSRGHASHPKDISLSYMDRSIIMGNKTLIRLAYISHGPISHMPLLTASSDPVVPHINNSPTLEHNQSSVVQGNICQLPQILPSPVLLGHPDVSSCACFFQESEISRHSGRIAD